MSCKKLNETEYLWEMVVQRCLIVGEESFTSKSKPEIYGYKHLTKCEAAIEKMKG
jgi:hypothetical protein